ncbi:Acyltransferase family protein [compost metagenome]
MVLSGTPLAYLLIFTIRIPIFFIGVWVGYLIDKKQAVSRVNGMLYLGMLLAGVVLLAASQKYMSEYVWSYGLWWYPFILITLPLCLFTAGGLHWVAERKWTRYPFLAFCGTHSLEIYLIHERMLKILADLRRSLDLPVNDLVLNAAGILLTLGLASLLKKAVNGFSARLKSGTKPAAAS